MYTHSRDPNQAQTGSCGLSRRRGCSAAAGPAKRGLNCKTLGARGRAGRALNTGTGAKSPAGPSRRSPAPLTAGTAPQGPARPAVPARKGERRAGTSPPPAAAARAPSAGGRAARIRAQRQQRPGFSLVPRLGAPPLRTDGSSSPLLYPAVSGCAPLGSGRAGKRRSGRWAPRGGTTRACRRHAPFKPRRRRLPLVLPELRHATSAAGARAWPRPPPASPQQPRGGARSCGLNGRAGGVKSFLWVLY